MVPFWTSFVVRTYALVNLLSDDGPIAGRCGDLGSSTSAQTPLQPARRSTIGIVYTYLPLMILPLFVALGAHRPRPPAGRLRPRRVALGVFRRVILPLSAPGIIAGCILVGVPATGEYVIPAILGGDKTLMYGNVVADQFLKVGDYPSARRLPMTLMAIVTVFLVVGRADLPRARRSCDAAAPPVARSPSLPPWSSSSSTRRSSSCLSTPSTPTSC